MGIGAAPGMKVAGSTEGTSAHHFASCSCGPLAPAFFGTGWQPMTARAMWWILAQAVFSLIGVGLITRAYQLAEASFVAVFEYSFLISAGVWAYVLWGDLPDAIALIGIGCVIAAGVVIILRSSGGREVDSQIT